MSPFHPRMFCWSLSFVFMKKMLKFVEISPVVLERKIFRFRQYIFAISLAPSLEKERGPSFEQT